MEKSAKELMHAPVVTVDKDVDLEHVLHVMKKHNVSKLPVTEKGRLVGVLTDGAIADELGALKNKDLSPGHLHASSVMSRTFDAATPDDTMGHIRNMLERSQLGLIPVTHDATVLGVITKADLLDYVTSDTPVVDAMVKHLHAVTPEDRVVHARRVMLDHGVERLPVIEDGKVVGIVAEMDMALAFETMKRRVEKTHQSTHLKQLMVRDIMTAPVVTIGADATIADAALLMRERDVGCLPVVNDDDVVQGLVTRSDLLRASHENGA